MRKQKWLLPVIILSVVGFLLAGGCSNNNNNTATGTLEFRANGEDFVRQGFVSKDGWSIEFDSIYVCLDNIKAYQTDPVYDAEDGELDTNTVEVQVRPSVVGVQTSPSSDVHTAASGSCPSSESPTATRPGPPTATA